MAKMVASEGLAKGDFVRITGMVVDRTGESTVSLGKCPLAQLGSTLGMTTTSFDAGDTIFDGDDDEAPGPHIVQKMQFSTNVLPSNLYKGFIGRG